MRFADASLPPNFLSFDDSLDPAAFRRLEEKLLDAEWVSGWSGFLRRLYAHEVSDEISNLPPAVLALFRSAAPSSLDETPERLMRLIETISAAPDGLRPLIQEGRISRKQLREAMLHPAAVADLHLALCTSESLYWIGRVEAAIRRSPGIGS